MGNPPWACLRKKDLGWDRGVESKKVVQHVYLVGAKSIYRVAEKDKEYLRDVAIVALKCSRLIWRRIVTSISVECFSTVKAADVSNFSKDKGTESIPNTSHRAQNSVFGQRFS